MYINWTKRTKVNPRFPRLMCSRDSTHARAQRFPNIIPSRTGGNIVGVAIGSRAERRRSISCPNVSRRSNINDLKAWSLTVCIGTRTERNTTNTLLF